MSGRSMSKKRDGKSIAGKRPRDPSTGRYLPMPKGSMSKKTTGKSMMTGSMSKKRAGKSMAGRSMSKKRAGKSMAGKRPNKSSSSKRRRHPKTGRFYLSKQQLLAEAKTTIVKKPVAAPQPNKSSK